MLSGRGGRRSHGKTPPPTAPGSPTTRKLQPSAEQRNSWWGWAVAALVTIGLLIAYNSGGSATAGTSSGSSYSSTSHRSTGDATVYGTPSVAENGSYYGE